VRAGGIIVHGACVPSREFTMSDASKAEPATTDKLFWEVEKLKAEVQNLRRPVMLTPATWVSVLSVLAAVVGIGVQWQRSNVESERAQLTLRESEFKRSQVQAELAEVERRKSGVEAALASLQGALDASEQRYRDVLSLTEATEKQLAELGRQLAATRAAPEAERAVETAQQSIQQARFDLGRERIAALIVQANADSADVRKAATQQLVREYGKSTLAIDMVIEQFDDSQVARLSPSGRINLLVFLFESDTAAWTDAQKAAALAAIARARSRAASGVAAIGAQTDEQLRRLEAKLRG
jgi:chromosome segregation ATPase